jgi:hypothetical protein
MIDEAALCQLARNTGRSWDHIIFKYLKLISRCAKLWTKYALERKTRKKKDQMNNKYFVQKKEILVFVFKGEFYYFLIN